VVFCSVTKEDGAMDSMNESEAIKELASNEAAFRRGVHHGVANTYRLLCQSRCDGLGIDEIIEKIGKLEDRIADWRNSRDEYLDLPPWLDSGEIN
jgi:hypothetical protein